MIIGILPHPLYHASLRAKNIGGGAEAAVLGERRSRLRRRFVLRALISRLVPSQEDEDPIISASVLQQSNSPSLRRGRRLRRSRAQRDNASITATIATVTTTRGRSQLWSYWVPGSIFAHGSQALEQAPGGLCGQDPGAAPTAQYVPATLGVQALELVRPFRGLLLAPVGDLRQPLQLPPVHPGPRLVRLQLLPRWLALRSGPEDHPAHRHPAGDRRLGLWRPAVLRQPGGRVLHALRLQPLHQSSARDATHAARPAHPQAQHCHRSQQQALPDHGLGRRWWRRRPDAVPARLQALHRGLRLAVGLVGDGGVPAARGQVRERPRGVARQRELLLHHRAPVRSGELRLQNSNLVRGEGGDAVRPRLAIAGGVQKEPALDDRTSEGEELRHSEAGAQTSDGDGGDGRGGIESLGALARCRARDVDGGEQGPGGDVPRVSGCAQAEDAAGLLRGGRLGVRDEPPQSKGAGFRREPRELAVAAQGSTLPEEEELPSPGILFRAKAGHPAVTEKNWCTAAAAARRLVYSTEEDALTRHSSRQCHPYLTSGQDPAAARGSLFLTLFFMAFPCFSGSLSRSLFCLR
ncbi:uncharacterized protein LOC9644313 [Selaginella moellendorffii]|uniref:uncharacterized protein LOC9644313 n=1 Tax=Selaginella moellendorffii TaxID=88036 RepID=UPI000D1CEF48|nr:uncharacterized protein LOC9644313 [Selaginella moellendorffii]|eukprot:XP_002983996.2 uncharacterized protein LOC9644313 [Selaginella moellendorffii]